MGMPLRYFSSQNYWNVSFSHDSLLCTTSVKRGNKLLYNRKWAIWGNLTFFSPKLPCCNVGWVISQRGDSIELLMVMKVQANSRLLSWVSASWVIEQMDSGRRGSSKVMNDRDTNDRLVRYSIDFSYQDAGSHDNFMPRSHQ